MSISDDDIARLLSGEEPGLSEHPLHDQLTDLANAREFIARRGAGLRYCHPWGRWLYWQGRRWQQDDRGRAEELAQALLHDLLREALHIDDPDRRRRRIRDAIAAEKAGRVRGMLELARARPGVPVSPDELDADPYALNCEGGTVDLRAGALRPHRPADLITKLAPADYDPAAQAPAWHAFLARCLPDPALRQFLQRAAGYSLAGGNPAQILLILWGSGANGKSTFIETLRRLFGDYGQQAPPETFLAKHEGIPNDVARLRGARFVACSEFGEGRRLNEPLIKRMTGGDTMTARFMRAEYFEFQPQFTPWLATNHKPEIRGTDEAIWRRIRLVPFTEVIPPAERDPDLKERLAAELPGILQWALAGCAAWQHDGLAEPPQVQAATAEYREEQDVLGEWLEDCCAADPGYSALSAELYRSYLDWQHAQGGHALEARAFGRKLGDRGYRPAKTSKGRAWLGIKLLGAQQDLL